MVICYILGGIKKPPRRLRRHPATAGNKVKVNNSDDFDVDVNSPPWRGGRAPVGRCCPVAPGWFLLSDITNIFGRGKPRLRILGAME
jgi:hypothetical protein